MNLLGKRVAWLAEVSRPARRRVTPKRFKEWYINRALDACSNATYIEIGVRRGESFRIARAARKIGVDPVRTVGMDILRDGEEFFATTSDDFFLTRARSVLEPKSVDVALIDGLHEFRQVVRDLLNLEPYMRKDGFIFLDDFNPRTPQRGSELPTEGPWNGDVWKLAPFLSNARPDLQFWTVDADEGVGVVTGFGDAPQADVGTVMEECKHLRYGDLKRDRPALLHLIRPTEFDAVLSRGRQG